MGYNYREKWVTTTGKNGLQLQEKMGYNYREKWITTTGKNGLQLQGKMGYNYREKWVTTTLIPPPPPIHILVPLRQYSTLKFPSFYHPYPPPTPPKIIQLPRGSLQVFPYCHLWSSNHLLSEIISD